MRKWGVMSESEISELEMHEPVSFGQQLMLAREKAGLTLDEAARALNLHEHTVEAIEDSDLDKLPPVAFVKGYIRTYAKLLGLSEEYIIKAFELEVPHELEIELHPRSVLPEEADSQTPVIKLISTLIVVFALLVLSYAIYSYYSEKSLRIGEASFSEEDGSSTQLTPEASLIESPAEITDDDALTIEVQSEASESEASELGTADVEATAPEAEAVIQNISPPDAALEMTEEIADELVSEAAEKENRPVPKVVPITGGDVLTVSAEKESWAEIVDANDIRLFYGMIKPGRELSLTGQAPFDIFLGNAPEVSLSFNATNIDMTKYIRSNNIAQFKISLEDGEIRFH